MRLNVVNLGNSKGVRFPKAVLEQCQIEDQLDMTIKGRFIQLRPVSRKRKHPREGWVEICRSLYELGDDDLLLPEHVDAEMDDWEW